MGTYTTDPVNLLLKIASKRKWYGDKIEARKAAVYKTMANRGELSHEKASEILELLGYEKIQEETWQKINA